MCLQVFGQVFVNGSAKPAYTGTSELNIEKGEAHVRATLRKLFPNIRRARLSVLKPDSATAPSIPQWFERIGGTINFSVEQIVARVDRSVPRRASKKAAKKRR